MRCVLQAILLALRAAIILPRVLSWVARAFRAATGGVEGGRQMCSQVVVVLVPRPDGSFVADVECLAPEERWVPVSVSGARGVTRIIWGGHSIEVIVTCPFPAEDAGKEGQP